MEFRNGCTGAPGCPGVPTHMYVPQGGFPVAYCVSCAPGFLKSKISTLPTTDSYVALTQKVVESLSPTEPEVVETVPELDADVTEEREAEEEAVPEEVEVDVVDEAPKKTRRPRRKKTTTSEDTDDTSSTEPSE